MHRARVLPKEEFRREVEKELTGKETEPHEIIYFKLYTSQIPVVEQAIETAALMLGTDKCVLRAAHFTCACANCASRSFTIDFAAFAHACGGIGFTVEDPGECARAIDELLNAPGPAVLQAVVDPFEPPFDGARSRSRRIEYNEERPHSSLGYKTPKEFAAAQAASFYGAELGQEESNAVPLPQTPIPAQTGDGTDASCRILK